LYFSVNLSNYFNLDSSPTTFQSVGICVSDYRQIRIAFILKPPNDSRYRRSGENKARKRETAKAQNNAQKRAESQPDGWLRPSARLPLLFYAGVAGDRVHACWAAFLHGQQN
jgi:hypothetical protein